MIESLAALRDERWRRPSCLSPALASAGRAVGETLGQYTVRQV
jgi:hypothetical protein